MFARLAALLIDPEQGRLRRSALIVLLVLAAVAGLGAISSARKKAPRSTPGAQQLLGEGRGGVSACVCPACGTVAAKPAGRECEEVACPRCRADMKAGYYFAGAAPVVNQQRASLPPPVDALAPVAPLMPLAVPRFGGMSSPRADAVAPFPMLDATQRGAAVTPPTWTVNFVPQRPGAATVCVCPGCGTRVPNDGHLYCPGLRCPACGRAMMAGVRVGAAQPRPAPGPGAAVADPAARGELVATPGAIPPCGRSFARPQAAVPSTVAAPINAPAYSGTVSEIVARNCLRCHGGALRNLSTYQNLRSYGQSGLLMMMIQPGGPMSHFLAPAEAQQLIDWVEAGEPR